jgi:hypothetical protein
LADEFNTNVNVINDVSSKYVSTKPHSFCSHSCICSWSIFLIGFGGIPAVMAMRKFGRLPVLFWSQVCTLSLGQTSKCMHFW